MSAFPRHNVPELFKLAALGIEGAGDPLRRGRREDRVTTAPMAPVRKIVHGVGTTGTSRIIRPSLRNGATAYT